MIQRIFEIWKILKRFVAAWSVLETYLCCGVIFGWPNLQKIFIEENIFCSDVTPAQNETSLDITATVSSSENVSTTISPTTVEVVTLGFVPKIFRHPKILKQNECKNL